MARAMMHFRQCRPAASVVAGAAAALVWASGCTICPDPYDYSGPVPNGSSPLNDFRARSNGILPLGAAPIPWPPVVQAAPTADVEPTTLAATAKPAVADADPADAEATPADLQSVVAEAAAEDAAVAVDATTDSDEPEPETVPTERPEFPPASEPARVEVPSRVPAVDLEPVPPAAETPGWRPRR